MKNIFEGSKNCTYYVKIARHRRVGREWNANDWNAKYNPMGCHALYYRTDQNPTRAFLHMTDAILEIEPGRVYFVPAFSVIKSEIDGEIEKYYVHFQSNQPQFGMYGQLLESHSVPADKHTALLFDILTENSQKDSPSSQIKMSCAMEIIMADFLEAIAVSPQDTEKFAGVLQYIEENFRKSISVSSLAKIMNMSTVYFSNIFKKAFHISPKQYILGKRLCESRLLLADTNMSVKEIAERVGFENENYFSEFFSAKVGMTALSFRKITRKNI